MDSCNQLTVPIDLHAKPKYDDCRKEARFFLDEGNKISYRKITTKAGV
jgi:hypothetical protein